MMAEKNMKNIHGIIASVIADRKAKASRLKAERIAYAEENITGYKELSEEIRKKGLQLGRTAFKGKNSGEYKSVQDELNGLLNEKELLFKNMPEGFFDDVYTCGVCRDEGFFTEESGKSVRCQCYRQLLADKLAENFAITEQLGTFETFRTDVYTLDPNDEDDIKDKNAIAPMSPAEYMSAVLEKCRSFTENFGKSENRNLLMWGKSGVGKSFMCNAIACDLIKKGIPVLYVSAPSMLSKATAITVNDEQRIEKQEFCDLVRNIDVLIIDDLGTEKQSDTKYQELLEILNERSRKYGKGLRTVISTNLSQKNMFRYYDERIASRIYAEFTSLKFIGENIRFKKK
ncbi:MAG: AAA family ATPase [Ruminococcaceae bacterium]|nr:AAA family ATPase [Oscillospiraceae bacterium]